MVRAERLSAGACQEDMCNITSEAQPEGFDRSLADVGCDPNPNKVHKKGDVTRQLSACCPAWNSLVPASLHSC
jgi:hypothetical protein